jgi:phosphate transport system substrate-binding protein
MFGKRVRPLPLATALVLSTAMTQAVNAEMVTLKSQDSSINITGDLLSFENGSFVVRTDMGDLKISAAAVLCSGPGCPASAATMPDIRFGGSDAIGSGLMPLLINGFATHVNAAAVIGNGPTDTATHAVLMADLAEDQGFGSPMGGIIVTSTVTNDAFRKLLASNVDVGMSSRRVTPEEARELRKAGAGLLIDPGQEHIVAADALVMIVNPNNPVTSISITDIAKIYAGQISNWSQLGGPDLPITVVIRPDSASTNSAFNTRIFGGPPPGTPALLEIAKTNRAAADTVNALDGAIAYVGQAFVRGAKVLPIVNECGISELPDAFAAKTGEYAIVDPLYLYTPATLDSDLVDRFIAYTKSQAADQVIAQGGFVDFGIATRDQGPESPRAVSLANSNTDAFERRIVDELLTKMDGTVRLSTTFRFKIGSTNLDPREVIDLERLVASLAEMPQGTTVRLVGFSDTDGEFEPNLNVSKQRADIVAKALTAAGGDKLSHVSIETLGYGEIAPVACNNSAAGREINRRVEVWVSQG